MFNEAAFASSGFKYAATLAFKENETSPGRTREAVDGLRQFQDQHVRAGAFEDVRRSGPSPPHGFASRLEFQLFADNNRATSPEIGLHWRAKDPSRGEAPLFSML
jgi:hypothetical protein